MNNNFILSPEEKQKAKDAYLQFLRIDYSIEKIKTIDQYESTSRWINLFDKKYMFADLTEDLNNKLRQIKNIKN